MVLNGNDQGEKFLENKEINEMANAFVRFVPTVTLKGQLNV